MKAIFLFLHVFNFILPNDNIISYQQAIQLILNTKEYKDYGVNKNDYNVSDEMVRFSTLSNFFKDEFKYNPPLLNNLEVIKVEGEFLKLNVRKCGKVKIFFSEEKNGVFFGEVFYSKTKKLKYEKRPAFGTSKLYMFRIENDLVKLVSVIQIQYN